MHRPLLLAAAFTLLLAGGALRAEAPLPDGLYAEFETPRGTFTAELFYQQVPLTVTSFVGLAEGTLGPHPGKPFFDGLTFHRVVPGFVIQGGDPLGNSEGGPGYEFPDEFSPGLGHGAIGILSMANSGPDTNGSQFFLTLAPVPRLDYLYTVFGRTIRGVDVLPQVVQGDPMHVRILRVGEAARAFPADQAAFDRLVATTPRYPYPHFEDADSLLPADRPAAATFNQKLTNLAVHCGLKVYFRLFEKHDPADAGRQPGQIAHRFAQKFGAATDGITALYFADDHSWAIWVGDTLLDRFLPGDTTSANSLHERKQALFAPAGARAAASLATLKTPDAKPLEPARERSLRTAAVIDTLTDLLLPRPPAKAP